MSVRFDDGKDEAALRTIGEVSQALDIRTHVLRYWEEQFPMLKPLKRSGGRRYYRPDDIELIKHIDRLVNREGYTLRGAKAALQAKAKQHGEVSEAPPVQTSSNRIDSALIADFKALRKRLAAALEG